MKKLEGLAVVRELMGPEEIAKALDGLARGIVKAWPDPKGIVLLGLRTGGVFLAERLRRLIKERAKAAPPMGVMDITLYRDDVFTGLPRPEVGGTELPSPLEGKTVVIVDDVLFTGRTIRSALAELLDYGRPQKIELAVLVDRGHRELPIQPDYAALTVKTKREESVRVLLKETGEEDRVVLCRKK